MVRTQCFGAKLHVVVHEGVELAARRACEVPTHLGVVGAVHDEERIARGTVADGVDWVALVRLYLPAA